MAYDFSFFDRPLDRRGTACVKWDERAAMPENGVPLWVADMDFRCADEIVGALQDRAQHPCYGYTLVTEEDRRAFTSFVKRHHGIDVSADETALMPCVITGLKTLVRLYSAPGDQVAILTPVYGPFTSSIEGNQRKAVRVELTRDASARYHIDFDRLEETLKSGVRLFLLCSPHNPVSRVWSREELSRILTLCRKYHTVLGVDEIHAEFVFPPHAFVSILSMADKEDQVISLMSASKTFNIAGLQQAVAVSRNEGMLKSLRSALEAAGVTSGNIFALTATRAAYEQGDLWLEGVLRYLDHNREVVAREIAERLPKAVLTPIEATYLAWLDLRAYAPDCAALAEAFRKAGVALTEGSFFGPEGEGFMRLNFGCPTAQLREGIKRMAGALNG